MASNLSALDRLRKAANLEPVKKEVTLSAVSYTHLTLPTKRIV